MASRHADPATARAVAFSRRTTALFAGLAPLTALLLPGALPAQGLPAPWQPRLPAVPGQNDPGLAGAHHAATGLTLTVGGNGAAAFDGRAFAALPGPIPMRTSAAMAYDRARQRTVLFGGAAAAGGDLDDTWEFDGTSWAQVATPAPRPSARHGAVLVYDEWRQRCVLVGGFVNGLGQGDTWEWDGAAWTSRALPPAGLRGGGVGAFDALRGQTILFGGSTTQGGPLRTDVWRYDGGGWLRLTPAVAPPPRVGAAMTYDRWSGRIVLFGGSDGTNLLADTWLWNGRTWSPATSSPAPAARVGAALALDERRGELVLLGGSNGAGARGEVWRLPVDPRPIALGYGAGCGGHSLATVPGSPPALGATFQLLLGGPPQPQLVSIGFSDVVTAVGPLPLPLPAPGGCSLWIDPAASVVFSPGASGVFGLAIPAQPALAGTEFHTQTFAFGGALTSSNGVTARIGTLQPGAVVASALDAAAIDPATSRLPGAVTIGGDGRHGPFDPSFGRDLGNGVFEFDTTATTIPGDRSPWGQPFTITDGNYLFDSMHVPAGVTVRFRGSAPARIRVRGTARIDGILDASGETMTTFVAVSAVSGQPGGRGGAGGGTGGAGGDRCLGFGPVIVDGEPSESGRPGQDVRVPTGHPLAGSTGRTGGPGSPLYPASGLMSAIHYTINNVFGSDLSAGGGGGGYSGPGLGGAVQPQPNLFPGPPTVGGAAFALPPVPVGTASIDWYLIGGAGGGGGASHPFAALITYPLTWRAGAGGSGGGGALALRCGNDLLVGSAGAIAARGGAGVTFSLWIDGYPSPGGGGSGGSLLLQSAGLLQNLGTLDVAGGDGSRIDNVVPTTLQAVSMGGAGAPGRIRLESAQTPVPGTTVPQLGSGDVGPLLDQDVRTGLRSVWLRVAPAGGSSVLERYELDLVWNGVAVTLSDDPAVGAPAALGGPIVARFQGTQEDAGGGPDPQAVGPWRTSFGSERRDDNCNLDVPQFVRIDLAFPTNPAPAIQQLRLYWH